MNPYQDVIDWLRSPEGSRWSEMRMKNAIVQANVTFRSLAGGWHLNRPTGDTIETPLYLAGVLSVKEQSECECR